MNYLLKLNYAQGAKSPLKGREWWTLFEGPRKGGILMKKKKKKKKKKKRKKER
jgi:hypothetical protein